MLAYIKDDELFTHWDHTAAVSGRLTSTNPNLQAVPKQPTTLHNVSDNYIIGRGEITIVFPKQKYKPILTASPTWVTGSV